MPLQFQPPQGKSRREQNQEGFDSAMQTAATIPMLLNKYKLDRMQQDMALQKMALERRQIESQIGTGMGPQMQPTADGTQPAETPEQEIIRLGTERYKLLHPQAYVMPGMDAAGKPTFTPLPAGTKPAPMAPTPTTILAPNGAQVGTVQGKATVLPQEKPDANQGLTPGQVALDKAFAKTYEEYSSSGGYSETQKGLGQIDDVISSLQSGEVSTGPFSGQMAKLPWGKNRKAVENIQDVIQSSFKQVLGSQFTEREGQRLMDRAYNPSQPPEENIKRLTRLKTKLDSIAQAKEAAGQYFEANGTLKGYQGPSISNPLELNNEAPPPDIPQVGATFQGAKVLRVTRKK